MPSHLPVLIVGAGPGGLMMASELARRDIPFRIIDQKAERSSFSNATWIQTGTLEILNQIGLLDRFLKAGHVCEALNLYDKGELSVKIPFSHLDSSYPFVLMLPQAETERLFLEHLAGFKQQVERSVELIDFRQEDNSIISILKHADGQLETLSSKWLIACDGVNSHVREKAGIHFKGNDFPEQFMVADAKMGSFLESNEIHAFFEEGSILPEKGTLFVAFPLGSNHYRITANLYLSHPRQTFTEIEVKEVVAERAHDTYTIEQVSWISPFWIHDRIADKMRRDSIFLLGDAAHIHSPIGGQGMNAGIQDAYNLAWKLALVIKGKAREELLDSYQAERHPLMVSLVNRSSKLTDMALFDPSFHEKLRKFSQKLAKHPVSLPKKIGMELTQLSLKYQDSPIIAYHHAKLRGPRPGARAPEVILSKSQRLAHRLHNTEHNVLLFTGLILEKDILQSLALLQNRLNQSYPGLLQTHLVSIEDNKDLANLIYDSKKRIHKAYQVKKATIAVIRPDNILAYLGTDLDKELIEKFLSGYLNKV